jgi:MUN domain
MFCGFRAVKAFEAWLKKGGKGTDYIVPTEMLVMMNVIADFKTQVKLFAC